jgi:hypothetical protein
VAPCPSAPLSPSFSSLSPRRRRRGRHRGWPVGGPLLERFAYERATPFARGQHRGIEIGAIAGTPVLAACAGRVSFAGTVPRYGSGATVVCGALAVSYLRLASVSVRRGGAVAAGDRLGRLGPRGLHFGVRRTGRRWAYLDPLALFGDRPRVRRVPLVPGARWRAGPRPFGAAPRPVPVPVPVTVPAGRPAPAVPLLAWLGLGLLAAGLPVLGLGRVRRRRSAWPLRPAPASRRHPAR